MVDEGRGFDTNTNYNAQLRAYKTRLQYTGKHFDDLAQYSDYLHYLHGDDYNNARQAVIRQYMADHPEEYFKDPVRYYFINDEKIVVGIKMFEAIWNTFTVKWRTDKENAGERSIPVYKDMANSQG